MSKTAFGTVIKELRVQKNMTQEKLAELAEVDRTYIYRIEHGLREPSFNIFLKLIEGLKTNADEFISLYKGELKNENQLS